MKRGGIRVLARFHRNSDETIVNSAGKMFMTMTKRHAGSTSSQPNRRIWRYVAEKPGVESLPVAPSGRPPDMSVASVEVGIPVNSGAGQDSATKRRRNAVGF